MTGTPNLPQWFRALGRARPLDQALVDPLGTSTFAELGAGIDHVAAGLREAGICRGDRIATMAAPSCAYVTLLLGAMAGGIAPTPMNTRLTSSELTAFAAPLELSAIVADAEYAGLAKKLGATVIELPETGPGPMAAQLAPVWAQRPDQLLTLDSEEPAIIFPTGGTTGTPKGVWYDHSALWLWMSGNSAVRERPPGSVELYFSPFFHVTLATILLSALFRGVTVVVQPKFDAGEALSSIEEHRVTHVVGAPAMLDMLREHPSFGSSDLTSVRSALFGSTAVTEQFIRRLKQAMPRAEMMFGYGATEAPWVTTIWHADVLAGRTRGIGRPEPGVVIQIVDEEGRPLPPGPENVGEFVISCPWQPRGYWGNPSETASVFRFDGVHIGDVGWIEPDGWVHISGRKKEVVISGGENVFPSEVEAVLREHPAVADVIVYGVPDERWGERVEAGVVLREPVSDRELQDFGRQRLGGYKVPKSIKTLAAVPLTANNKPDRNAALALPGMEVK